MYIIICSATGRREGIVLSADQTRMRVSVPDLQDVIELRQIEGRWFGEDGAEIEIESLVLDRDPGETDLPIARPRAAHAGTMIC